MVDQFIGGDNYAPVNLSFLTCSTMSSLISGLGVSKFNVHWLYFAGLWSARCGAPSGLKDKKLDIWYLPFSTVTIKAV